MSRKIKVGNLYIGGGEKITVQSMTTVKTSDTEGCAQQINELVESGCDIVRVAVNSAADAEAVKGIKALVGSVPIVADIQFDYRLAVAAIEAGVDKVRINPGNIGSDDKVRAVADCARMHKVPIRVGVNSGSIEHELLDKYGRSERALAESALNNVSRLEKFGFCDIIISVKSSSVAEMVKSCRIIHSSSDYPQHLGVTEAGTYEMAAIKSAAGIGALLLDGIGDTIRVSVTGNPKVEAGIAHNILRSVGLETDYVDIVSCPTCSRCTVDLESLANEVALRTRHIKKRMKIAVMGCVVNGPGEAKDAYAGIAGGGGRCVLFHKGVVVKKVNTEDAVDELVRLIEQEG